MSAKQEREDVAAVAVAVVVESAGAPKHNAGRAMLSAAAAVFFAVLAVAAAHFGLALVGVVGQGPDWGMDLLRGVVAAFVIAGVMYFRGRRDEAASVEAAGSEAGGAVEASEETPAEMPQMLMTGQDESGRRQRLEQIASRLETDAQAMVEEVMVNAELMHSTIHQMSGMATQSAAKAGAVSASAQEAAASTDTIAASVDELTQAIREISTQVASSANVTSQAVTRSEEAGALVQNLENSAQAIGEIVSLIQGIAKQTNLLALNATIEAARAGDAGKGFAVVANEVKSLATQTAQATEDISAKIDEIQSITSETVGSIGTIKTVIDQINESSSAISAAIEEQNATTEQVSGTVNMVAEGTRRITENISEVNSDAEGNEARLSETLTQVAEVARVMDQLSATVRETISEIRAA